MTSKEALEKLICCLICHEDRDIESEKTVEELIEIIQKDLEKLEKVIAIINDNIGMSDYDTMSKIWNVLK